MDAREGFEVDGVDVRALPKVALHDHLDGGLRPATLVELADAAGIAVPSRDPAALAAGILENSESGSLPEYLTAFGLTVAVMQTPEALERVAREAVEDLAADGVVHAELRWAPEQHQAGGLSLDETVEAVTAGIRAGVERAAEAGRPVSVGQLLTILRHEDRGLDIAALALRHRDRGALGFDVAGPEDGFPPSRFRDAFDLLADEFFPVTVHAGEAAGLESIRSALVDGRALRLGHGVRLVDDVSTTPEPATARLGSLARWVLDRRITLEMCPTSNLQTGAVGPPGTALAEHPFDRLYRLGFAVTVNSDNRLVSGTTLSRELALLAGCFGYGLADLETFQLTAVEAAFLPLGERRALAERVRLGFATARSHDR